MNKIRVLTGITPSGKPHIGNLCGAILPAVKESQEKNVDSFLFLADYHSLIKHQDPILTHSSSIEMAACWLSCGLDHTKTTFYRQSDISNIMELNWILSCITEKGLLNRAHAYKDAVDKNSIDFPDKNINMGLFNYPLLMSADILMFNADIVPVGKDQVQHLEITRDIALKFNYHYGEVFSIPEARVDDHKGLLLGIDGQKMSKSYGNEISIFLNSDDLRKRIMKITTNSLKPGQPKDYKDCTIFNIYSAFSSKKEVESMKLDYENGIAWSKAKEILYQLLNDKLSVYRKEYSKLLNNLDFLEDTLQDGAERASLASEEMIKKIRYAVGIRKIGG